MSAGIKLNKIWSDEDMVEFRISIDDGESRFCNKVYVGHAYLRETVAGLDRFKDQVYGGIYELRFGEFGPEYASGALHARLHFQDRGRVYITASAQTEFFNFGRKNVASASTLHFFTEPAQLDDFIRTLRAVSQGQRMDVKLDASGP